MQWSAIEDKAVRKKVQWGTRWPVREGMEERRARKRVYGGKGSQKWSAIHRGQGGQEGGCMKERRARRRVQNRTGWPGRECI